MHQFLTYRYMNMVLCALRRPKRLNRFNKDSKTCKSMTYDPFTKIGVLLFCYSFIRYDESAIVIIMM